MSRSTWGRPTADPLAYKDAVFLSPHKFVGGPGTPGVLVVRRDLVTEPRADGARRRHGRLRQPDRAPLPHRPGGAGGGRHPGDRRVDPGRAGLPAQAGRRGRGDPRRGSGFIRRAIDSWGANPNIEILGNLEAERLSIVSFVVRHGGRYLHHNFVVALLNDLFGIQARGGCSCAGPYGHRLLGIDLERSHEFEREIARGCEGIKPGWVRVNFNYFISEAVFDYILEAVDLVADHGWRLLRDYRFDPATGLWRHRRGPVEPPLRLADLGYDADGRLRCRLRPRHRLRRAWPPTWTRPAALLAARPRPWTATAAPAPPGVGRLRGPALVRAPARVPLARRVEQAGGRAGAAVQVEGLGDGGGVLGGLVVTVAAGEAGEPQGQPGGVLEPRPQPAVWSGDRVSSAPSTSITMAGSNQTSAGCRACATPARYEFERASGASRAGRAASSASLKPVPHRQIVGNVSVAGSYAASSRAPVHAVPAAAAVQRTDHDEVEGVGQLAAVVALELDPQPAPGPGLVAGRRARPTCRSAPRSRRRWPARRPPPGGPRRRPARRWSGAAAATGSPPRSSRARRSR